MKIIIINYYSTSSFQMKKITKSPATQSKQIKQVAAKKTVKKIT